MEYSITRLSCVRYRVNTSENAFALGGALISTGWFGLLRVMAKATVFPFGTANTVARRRTSWRLVSIHKSAGTVFTWAMLFLSCAAWALVSCVPKTDAMVSII